MITRRFYTRTDKAVINRLLIAEIRDYLIEQGRLRYATVAAEMRKEARRMTGNNLNVEKPAPVASATPSPAVKVISNTGDTIDSLTLLKMVNEARKLCGEPEVRNNKFIEKILDELDGEHYTKSVVEKMNKTSMLVITMTFKQALRVAARESKAVRRSLIDKLEELQQANSLPHRSPKHYQKLYAWLPSWQNRKCSWNNSWWPQPLKSILPTGYQWLMES